ncbi:LysR family transcriptional regulator [Litorivivens sp.]|uniref:LysR family transcriptional regulator n=1 Tax=Litorivivens sp. TaxID=2020868 RepID=UPI0035640727
MARWDGIYEFVQVVEHHSFTDAAKALDMSTSQVSKLISRLEDRLGTRLLLRTTRSLALTDEGQQFYRRSKLAIDTFEKAEEDLALSRNEPRGNLKVNISGVFQERFLVPILANFTKQYPHLQVQLDFTDKQPDLVKEGYDLSVCYGELKSSTLVARKLADNFNYLVASPDYLDDKGEPETLEDLQQHNCLMGVDALWYLSDGSETVQIHPDGNWRSDNGAALLSAARCGLGIASLPFFSVMDDISQGTLKQVLPQWNQYPQPVWIMYPQQRHLPIKVRLFIDYLLEELNNIVL